MQAFSSTGNAGQPLVGEIYPSHDDDSENPGIDPVTVLLQPSPSQSQASGSAPHQIHHHHHPGNTSIYRNDADLQHQYDPSTNPYTSLSVMQMPSPPWNIPSQPQVRFPPQFVGYGQRLLANQNQNFNYRPSESPSSIQAPTFSASPLPPLPLSYNSLGLGVSYPSDALSDPFNLDAPVFLDQPDILGDQELRDDIAEVEPTPIVPSHTHIVSVIPRYPLPNLNAFLPQFTEPVLSKDGDVLLPPGCEDECPGPRDPIAATAHPEDDSTFRFYRGPSDRRGRKAKPKAEVSN
jgi:hypothetical protein